MSQLVLKVVQGQKIYGLNKCRASFFVSLESSSSALHIALVNDNYHGLEYTSNQKLIGEFCLSKVQSCF